MEADFKEQINFLKKNEVLSVDELPAFLEGRKKKKSVFAVTFDDGFENNMIAAEILKKHKIPWSLFISTGRLMPDRTIWTAELSLLILYGDAGTVEFSSKSFPLTTQAEREAAFQTIRIDLKSMSAEKKNIKMDLIRKQFPKDETERLLGIFPSFKMLSWDQIRRLSADGVEIGSHGVDHEIHHERQSSDVRKKELVESKAKIEKELTKPCRFFAYPNGNFSSVSPEEVKVAGYELAFTTQPGRVLPGSERFLLPRIEPSEFFKNLGRLY